MLDPKRVILNLIQNLLISFRPYLRLVEKQVQGDIIIQIDILEKVYIISLNFKSGILVVKLPTILIGKKGEDTAEKYLKKQGYRILGKNYKSPSGEIDIIALDKGTLVFIEVKTRRSDEFGPPEISVTSTKRQKIIKSAFHFLSKKRIKDTPCRFDIVSITGSPDQKEKVVKIIKDAFEIERW